MEDLYAYHFGPLDQLDDSNCICAWYMICYNWCIAKFNYLMENCRLLRHIIRIWKKRGIPSIEQIARCSETRDWATAQIRFISIHPINGQMAVLTFDDRVLIYPCPGNDTPFVLQKQRYQGLITCAAWRPWAHGDLAVGSSVGICLWRNTHLPYKRNIQKDIHCDEKHTYITSLQWDTNGVIVASAAIRSKFIILWNPDSNERRLVVHISSNSCDFRVLKWRPHYNQLLALKNGKGVVVWDLQSKKRIFRHICSNNCTIQTAIWSTCGLYLYFAFEKDSRLFASSMYFNNEIIFAHPIERWTTQLVCDLASVTCRGEQRCCGNVQSMAIDKRNIYLALIFEETPFVLLCLLAIKPMESIRILPLEYIDLPNAYPLCIAFDCIDDCATRMLAIGWSSGHVQRQFFRALTTSEVEECECPDDMVTADSTMSSKH